MKFMIGTGLLLSALVLPTGAAQAQWCAQYDPYTYNCGFYTFQQCLDTISGVGGVCRRDADYSRYREEGRRDREQRPRDERSRDRY